jgi:hypothetical protein
MLKEEEESKKTQLEENEEDIKILKNEIEENKKLDDQINKSIEVNFHLKTRIEEAKRVEELLKNQVNEKEGSCHKLEAKVFYLRKKVEKSKKFLNNEIEENKKLDDQINKSIEVNFHLKTQIEEAKRVEELLKNQVNEKEGSCHKLEAKVFYLRKKVEKSKKFLNISTILNKILDSQGSPNDKSGLGYKKEATHVEASTSKKHEVSPSLSKDGNNVASQSSTQGKESFKRTKQGRHQEAIFTPQRRETHSRWTPKQRHGNVFHGQFYSYNEYGHKALECRYYARKNSERYHNTLRCWRCNQVGHIAAHYHTMRCYSCSGFDHKSRDFWNTRRKSIMRTSYSMTRRRHEVRKEDIFENTKAQRSSYENLGHLQKWVKKTEQSEKNGSLKGSSSLSS